LLGTCAGFQHGVIEIADEQQYCRFGLTEDYRPRLTAAGLAVAGIIRRICRAGATAITTPQAAARTPRTVAMTCHLAKVRRSG
jgi:hypothetical protein